MSKKDNFIEEITQLLQDAPENFLSEDALDYWNGLQMGGSDKPQFTDNGKIILQYIKDNKEQYNNLFKAKDIGEGLGISSRTASGALRKLVSDGFVEKIESSPVVYAITKAGEEVNIT